MAMSQSAQFGPILTNEEQFRKEIQSLPRYTEAERRAFIDPAWRGDIEARDAFMLSFTGYIVTVARRYTFMYASSHRIEFLDLVQIAQLALLENMEKALQHPNPIGFLNKTIVGALLDHCRTRAGLIVTPRDHDGGKPVKECRSLDAPLSEDQNRKGKTVRTLGDVLPSDVHDVKPEHDHSVLYQALETLPDDHRELVTCLYGIDCAPEPLTEIMKRRTLARGGSIEGKHVCSTALKNRILAKLRAKLEPISA